MIRSPPYQSVVLIIRSLIHKHTKMIKPIIKLLLLIFVTSLSWLSCNQNSTSRNPSALFDEKNDTIIAKRQNELNPSYELGFLSKSYSYFWIVDQDTLNFSINARQYIKDSTLHLSIHHKEPTAFSTAIVHIDESLSIIQEDFPLTKLGSIYFTSPIYYTDVIKELSVGYEKQFGRKSISYEQLNELLFQSNLNKQIDIFVSSLNKKVIGYSIEKFHLTDKQSLESHFKNIDFSEFPEYVIDGIGLQVQLSDE